MPTAISTRSLTERSGLELARAIREREVSARDVLEAHIDLLRTAGLNAFAAERFDGARADADAIDARLDGGETDLPPYLGVPFTVKE